jgi:hypothetical protein
MKPFDRTLQRIKPCVEPRWFNAHSLADGTDLTQYLQWRDLALSEAVPFGDYRP